MEISVPGLTSAQPQIPMSPQPQIPMVTAINKRTIGPLNYFKKRNTSDFYNPNYTNQIICIASRNQEIRSNKDKPDDGSKSIGEFGSARNFSRRGSHLSLGKGSCRGITIGAPDHGGGKWDLDQDKSPPNDALPRADPMRTETDGKSRRASTSGLLKNPTLRVEIIEAELESSVSIIDTEFD